MKLLLTIMSAFIALTASQGFAMNLKETLDKKRADFAATAPQELQTQFDKGVADVRALGVEDAAKNVGDSAPDFTLPNAVGEQISLADLRAQGPVVITWYRGGWCPYCNLQLHALQQILPQLKEAGATLVAISPELPNNSLDTKQKGELEFHVLSDVGNKIAKDFGVAYTLPDYIAEKYQEFFDLHGHNGDTSEVLPLSASYVINTDGTITYAFVDADYRNRAEPAELLKAVEALR